jgi:hypothetical protein
MAKQVKENPKLSKYQSEIRCPIHKCLLGKYDMRTGILNATFFCQKCKIEYTFTIPAQKN